MDRYLWRQSITKHSCPPWSCPVCHKGKAVMVKNSLVYKETASSAASHNEDGFDWSWIDYVFTAWAKCNHPSCGQEFAISGTGGIEPEIVDERGNWEYVDHYIPASCSPMPNIFEIPAKSPEPIKLVLREAFAIFWGNRAACASRIRVALELLMDHVAIPKRKKGKSGKFYDLSLHERIEMFAEGEPTIGTQLMALKWLGNTGSHDGNVNLDDLLDAFEIFEHALREIIEGHSTRVAQLAKKLISKHKGKK